MPIIRPISDLRNNFSEISEICHAQGEPVFVTKNGAGDLVVMSIALFEKQQALLELYRKLGEAEKESKSITKRISHKEVIKKLRDKMNE